MTYSLQQVEGRLNSGSLGLAELLSLRRELGKPFSQHPLGFLACRLLSEGSRNLRLHYWPLSGRSQQDPNCQIHDHLFEFKSWVLAGSLQNVEYGPSSEGREFAVYRTQYDANRSLLIRTGEVRRFAERSRYTLSAGASYQMRSGVFHQTILVGNIPAFSVLLTTDASEESPLVLCPLDGPDLFTYERKDVEESAVKKLLAEFFPE